LLTSIVAVALIIERSISLRAKKIIPAALLEQVASVYQRQGVNEEILGRLAKDSPLGAVLAAGLRNHKSSRYVMKEAIEEAGRAVAHDMQRFLTTLGTIATASPLLGLFGTVIGMIEIFGSQSPGGTNPQQLAHGISVALYNTAFGIAIAIPALIFYRHFMNKVDSFVVEMELLAAKLVDVVHGERMDFQGQPQRA
jgi:biopolymer transport protein ExbB